MAPAARPLMSGLRLRPTDLSMQRGVSRPEGGRSPRLQIRFPGQCSLELTLELIIVKNTRRRLCYWIGRKMLNLNFALWILLDLFLLSPLRPTSPDCGDTLK